MTAFVRFRGINALLGGAPQEWVLPADAVTHIAAAPPTTSVPGAPAHVAGLAALDVGVVPVFRLSETPRHMIVCIFNESPVGLLVDAVLEIGGLAQREPLAPMLDLEQLLRSAHKAMRKVHSAGESER